MLVWKKKACCWVWDFASLSPVYPLVRFEKCISIVCSTNPIELRCIRKDMHYIYRSRAEPWHSYSQRSQVKICRTARIVMHIEISRDPRSHNPVLGIPSRTSEKPVCYGYRKWSVAIRMLKQICIYGSSHFSEAAPAVVVASAVSSEAKEVSNSSNRRVISSTIVKSDQLRVRLFLDRSIVLTFHKHLSRYHVKFVL